MDYEYLEYRIGKKRADEIIRLTKLISENKNRIKSDSYTRSLKDILYYYEFESDDSDETIEVDLLLEKNQIVHDVEVCRDSLIALIRYGIIVIP